MNNLNKADFLSILKGIDILLQPECFSDNEKEYMQEDMYGYIVNYIAAKLGIKYEYIEYRDDKNTSSLIDELNAE